MGWVRLDFGWVFGVYWMGASAMYGHRLWLGGRDLNGMVRMQGCGLLLQTRRRICRQAGVLVDAFVLGLLQVVCRRQVALLHGHDGCAGCMWLEGCACSTRGIVQGLCAGIVPCTGCDGGCSAHSLCCYYFLMCGVITVVWNTWQDEALWTV